MNLQNDDPKNDFANALLGAGSAFALLAMPATILRLPDTDWPYAFWIQSAAVLFVLGLAAFRKHLPADVKLLTSSLLSAVLGMAHIYSFGLQGTGSGWLLLGAFILLFNFGHRISLAYGILCLAGLLLLAKHHTSAVLPEYLVDYSSKPISWAITILVVIFFYWAISQECLVIAEQKNLLENQIAAQQEELLKLENFDKVTGLPVVRVALDRLDIGLKKALRTKTRCGLLLCEVSGLADINKSGGYSKGDEIIKAVSIRISEMLRLGDTLARYFGNTFLIVTSDLENEEALASIKRRIHQAFDRSFETTDGASYRLSCLIVPEFSKHSELNAKGMLKRLEKNLALAKTTETPDASPEQGNA